MNEQMSVVLGTVAMEPKGEYSAEAYYEKLNTVLYNDSTYMAIKPSHNILPTDTEYWQLIGGGVTRDDIVDNLNSNDSTKILSAKQGRVLNESIEDIKNVVKFHSISESSATYIVEFPNSENLIIDTGQSSQWLSIKSAIDKLGITKFDYMILTHFHSDHIGNIQNLVNNYDLSDCKCWVQMKPDFENHSADISETESEYDNVITLLRNNGLNPSVPENNSYYTVDDNTKLHFLNTSEELAENYYGQYTEYKTTNDTINFNHFSLVTEIIYKNTVFLATGDIERACEEAISPYIHKCDVLTAPHHGVNRDAYKAFYYAIKPTYSICSYVTDNDNWVKSSYKSFMYLKELSSYIITAAWTTPVNGLFSFISNGNSVNTNVIDSKIVESNIKTPRVYSNPAELINFATQQTATITLLDLIANMSSGSIFRCYFWDTWENGNYAQLFSDIKDIFPCFTGNCVVEIKTSYGSSNKYIKVYDKDLEYSAIYNNDVNGWENKTGSGLVANQNSTTNLISKLRTLPKGIYHVGYFSDTNEQILAGAYALIVNVVENNTNLLASIIANQRNTGSSASDITRCAGCYINTTNTPQYIWYKLNN